MKKLNVLSYILLFLLSSSLHFSSNAEMRSKGSGGKNNPNVFGHVYISVNPYITWMNGVPTMSMTDHRYSVYNFAAKSCNYEYEYKQWLSHYDNVKKETGDNINEDKGWGSGKLEPIDEEDNNWPDYYSGDTGFQNHYLPDYNLTVGWWYVVGGYTRLVVESRKGSDSWEVYSDDLIFQW